jgi:hypothetical protein
VALVGCERKSPPPPRPAPEPAAVAVAAPRIPPPAISRSELLQAMEAARSAYATGRREPGDNLAGRRFAVRQAFGCPGTAAGQTTVAGMARWSWRPNRKSIEISLTPADWADAPMMTDTRNAWEAVEGFWLPWPWTSADRCPAAWNATLPEQAAALASPQTDGLASVFERGGSRLGRRGGKAFTFTVRGEPALAPPAGGYRLILEGRLTAFPDGRTIRCHARSPDERPVCIAAAEVDRVAFEDADGAVLSEWQSG